ncbi:hypothetical protein MMOR_28660 [Mycolicibacterium moriokaense]|uniref:Uncharacterized protein n=1 Tax=Mycolicibacterium moriokaense TaxID=39691 RepID=A0AAD1HAV1_9MYCO|nr:hypothetical protein MMOR_28660 [Mycolicibacterium moriokaense]
MVSELSGQPALQNGFDHLGQKPALTGQLQLTGIDLGKSPGVVGFRELRPMVLGVSLPVLGWAIA